MTRSPDRDPPECSDPACPYHGRTQPGENGRRELRAMRRGRPAPESPLVRRDTAETVTRRDGRR